jgi:hypothetical protein
VALSNSGRVISSVYFFLNAVMNLRCATRLLVSGLADVLGSLSVRV